MNNSLLIKRLQIAIVAVLFAMYFSAQADIVNFNFGSAGYFEGQSLEGAVAGDFNLSSEAGDLHYTNYYGKGLYAGYGASSDIFIDFSVAVSNLSFTAGDGAGDYDAFAVTLYEFGTNALLGTFSTPKFGGPNEPEWYTLVTSLSNIGRVVFDPANSGILPGQNGGAGGVILNSLSYNKTTTSVPEPSSLLLLSFGLLSLAGISRKIRNKN